MKNKITPQDIQDLLNSAETQEAVFWGKEVVVSYRFPTRNGFSVLGRGACVDPANFDIEIGRKVAREQVENKLRELEGYLLQQQLPYAYVEDGFLITKNIPDHEVSSYMP